MVVGCLACRAHTEEQMTLSRLEIPSATLVLYEYMLVRNPDRSANWRFRIGTDRGFYNARNRQLFVTDPEARKSEDPAKWFDTPFPEEPQRRFTEEQYATLKHALESAQPDHLEDWYTSKGKHSNPSVERWTFVLDEARTTVVVEDGAAPQALADLRETIDRLVAAAPRP